ncbi:hypothetical Protein YC6258_03776 [Gynuella sunshinyii YC6258]|uniref:Uncharacterized protein n=1 Tax=Gynuella sunshinyii YC6258 TaxID=1445510 RepID=A0A0C5VDH2_9GAMM|nr:hypothetical Protein YC6258_00189 [Gynuella sunshinyii YC6258]AJQ95812.1 hypothetical Protein YC6258_03776 [Gynuella sunshinyii YC6258]
MSKTTTRVVLISLASAAAVVWAVNNVDAVDNILGDRGWF